MAPAGFLVLILLISSWQFCASRRSNIYGFEVEENGATHSNTRVTFGPRAAFLDNKEKSQEAIEHWARLKEMKQEIDGLGGKIWVAQTQYAALTRSLQAAVELPNANEKKLASMRKTLAQKAQTVAQLREQQEELLAHYKSIEPHILQRSDLVISRDHIITHAVWAQHFQFANPFAKEHGVRIKRDQAKELSDTVMNGPDNLIGMSQFINRKVKVILEDQTMFQDALNSVQALITEYSLGPRMPVQDDVAMPNLMKPINRHAQEYIAMDMLIQSLLEYFDSPEYGNRRNNVFEMYEQWLIRCNFGDITGPVLADLTQRTRAFEELMKERGRAYHASIGILRQDNPEFDIETERTQSARAVIQRSEDHVSIEKPTKALKTAGFLI